MNPSYRKEKDNDYMILESPGRPEGSEYQIRMLQVNNISGLLACKMRKVDGAPEFCYDITERQPMTRAFEKQLMGKKDIESLFRDLEKAMDESERYLLEMEELVLKPDYIFRSEDTGSFAFCYLPLYDGSLEADFRELAEFILKRLDHSQEEAVLWGYDIYSRSVEEHFSMGKILESVHERAGRELQREKHRQEADREEPEYEEYMEEGGDSAPYEESTYASKDREPPPKKESPRERIVSESPPDMQTCETHTAAEDKWGERKPRAARPSKKRDRKGRSIQARAEIRGKRKQVAVVLLGMIGSLAAAAWAVWSQGLNFIQAGGILVLCMGLLVYFTTVFQKKPRKKNLEEEVIQWENSSQESDRTVFLGQPLPEEHPVLVSMDTGKSGNIVLDKPIMKLGKQKDQVDIFLPDSSVSRIHAVIEKEEDGWYLRDCHSTNGTYVKGERLSSDEKRKLEDGEEIWFSNYHFYFYCHC